MDAILAIQHLFGPALYSAFMLVTSLGSETAYVVLLALYYWLIDPRFGRRLGLLIGLSFAANTVVRDLVNTPRPYVTHPGVATQDAIDTGGGGSFPSFHTQGAATFWFAVAARHRRAALWVLAGVIVLVVAVSRLYLGVHYPIDVLGGLALGLAFAAASLAPATADPGVPARAAVAVLALAAAVAFPDLDRPLGVAAGFFASAPRFTPPRAPLHMIVLAALGLVAVFAVYFVLGRALGDFGRAGAGAYLRYLALTLFATEGWPRVAARLGARATAPAAP